jgi:hypothetical protein
MSEVVSDFFDAASCACDHNADYHNLFITSDFLIVACDRCRDVRGACFRATRDQEEVLRAERAAARAATRCPSHHRITGARCELYIDHMTPHEAFRHTWVQGSNLRSDRCLRVSARSWRQCTLYPGHEGDHANSTSSWSDERSLCESMYGTLRCTRQVHDDGQHEAIGERSWATDNVVIPDPTPTAAETGVFNFEVHGDVVRAVSRGSNA